MAEKTPVRIPRLFLETRRNSRKNRNVVQISSREPRRGAHDETRSNMGKDYYKILGVPKDADDAAIKKAYRKGAVRWHPDKNPNDKSAEGKFKEIGEAFDVLSDPNKRAVYDRYGEDGLKRGGAPPPETPGGAGFNAGGAGGVPPGFAGFSSQGGVPGGGMRYEFSGQDAFKIFEQMFGGGGGMGGMGGSSPFAGMGGVGGMGGMGGMEGMFGGDVGGTGPRAGKRGPRQDVVKLPVDLEDLYKGGSKRVKVTRRVNVGAGSNPGAGVSGSVSMREEPVILDIDIKPGWKAGTKLTFPGKGDETPGVPGAARELVVVIEEKPHPTYTREGDDLVCRMKKIPLKEALCGLKVTLDGVDGEPVVVKIDDGRVVSPGFAIRAPGRGMPNQKTGARGAVKVIFESVQFPERLTQAQRDALKAAFRMN